MRNSITRYTSLLVLLLTIGLTGSSFASEIYESRISDVDFDGESALVYLENSGRVLRLNAVRDESLISKLRVHFESGEIVQLSVSERGENDEVLLLGVLPPEAETVSNDLADVDLQFTDEYQPTDFGTVENVQAWFRRLERDMKQESQCYQRAHNWAWMMWKLGGLKTQKTFIFFTKRYIREFKYKWWFHVAPVALVQGTMIMMDRTFTGAAISLPRWKNIYMKNGAECPVVLNYTQYSTQQESQYCYLMFAPMYYYQPINLERREKGVVVKGFQTWELKHMTDAMRGKVYRKWKRSGLFNDFI